MNNPAAPTASPALVKGRKRDLLPLRMIVVIDFLRGEAASNDAELEQAIAVTVTGMKDGSIRPDVGKDLLVNLFAAFRNNDHMHDVLSFVRESSMEVAQVEVDRIGKLRRDKGLKS